MICNDQVFDFGIDGEFTTFIAPQYFCYFAALTLQTSFIGYLYMIVAEKAEKPDEQCQAGDWYLRMICTLVFVASVISDLNQTFFMHKFMRQIPKWVEERDRKNLERCFSTSGLTNFPHQKYISDEYPGETLVKPAIGITHSYRLYCYIGVLFPKVAIALALLPIGAGHLLSSGSREEIILNTLAAIFVFEVDDIMYNLMISPIHKLWLEKSSTIQMCEDEVTFGDIFTFYIVSMITAIFSFGVYQMWC